MGIPSPPSTHNALFQKDRRNALVGHTPRSQLTLGVFVAQGLLSHVTETNGALAAAVDEEVAADGVKLRGGDHFSQLLHVGRLYVHNVCLQTQGLSKQFGAQSQPSRAGFGI